MDKVISSYNENSFVLKITHSRNSLGITYDNFIIILNFTLLNKMKIDIVVVFFISLGLSNAFL